MPANDVQVIYVFKPHESQAVCTALQKRKITANKGCEKLYVMDDLTLHFDRKRMYAKYPVLQLQDDTEIIIEAELIRYYMCHANDTYNYGPQYFLNELVSPRVDRIQFSIHDPIPYQIQDTFLFALDNDRSHAMHMVQHMIGHLQDLHGPYTPAVYLLNKYKDVLFTHGKKLQKHLPVTRVMYKGTKKLYDLNMIHVSLGYDCNTACVKSKLFTIAGNITHSIQDVNREIADVTLSSDCLKATHVLELNGDLRRLYQEEHGLLEDTTTYSTSSTRMSALSILVPIWIYIVVYILSKCRPSICTAAQYIYDIIQAIFHKLKKVTKNKSRKKCVVASRYLRKYNKMHRK